jgi:hypothetical protein
MGTISTNEGDFFFDSVKKAIEIMRGMSRKMSEAWISGDNPYPCLAICINDEYAAVTYFQDEDGEIYLSCNAGNKNEVEFKAGGEEWKPDPDVVISFEDAIKCVEEFLNTGEQPSNIKWQHM